MPERESDPGFTFVDKRRRIPDDSAPAHEAPPRPRTAPPAGSEPPSLAGEPPRADFAWLCVMFCNDGLVQLGQLPDPITGQPQTDLDQARFTIDLLAMLKEKTEGNRTPEESALLDEILSTLRMTYVRLSPR